ncbi:MAG: helix-turn-helix transcriptional regulator [Cytophagales bacterium]|nr:helix-turn-helix transcriptional regulator [Cytophagales bacterium]
MFKEHHIRKIRESKGYSQHFVAKQLGMSQNNYWKIENGKVDIKLNTLQQLAIILNVEMNQLLAGSPTGASASATQQHLTEREQLYQQLLQSKAHELLLQQQLLSKQQEITQLIDEMSKFKNHSPGRAEPQ